MPEYSRPPGERIAQPEQSPELQEFLRATQDAYAVAQRYNGTEDGEKELFTVLERVADAVQHVSGATGSSLEREAKAAQMLGGELHGVDIQSLLAIAGEQAHKRVRSAFDFDGTETPSTESLFIKRVNGIILLPGNAPDTTGSGETIWEPVRFEPRVQEIRQLLEAEGIYADDYVITIGEVSKDMMRKASYAIIEIPRLQRTILVCDQVGEATFVLRGHFSPEALTAKTKEQLQTEFPDNVRRLIRFDVAQWAAEIKLLLLSEDLWQKTEGSEAVGSHKKEKVDVRMQDRLRQAIMELYPTAEAWIKAGIKRRSELRIPSFSIAISAISRFFGITGQITIDVLLQLQLGLKIYGEENSALQKAIAIEKRTPEDWRKAIQMIYPTAEDWLRQLASQGIDSIPLIDGKGIRFFGKIFGLEKNPQGNRLLQIELGIKIYGAENPNLQESKRIGKPVDVYLQQTVRSEFIKQFPTANDWLSAEPITRAKSSVAGLSMVSLASLFSIPGNIRSALLPQLQLGQKIYGADDPAIRKAIELEVRTPDDWRRAIMLLCPTADDWLRLDRDGRRALRVDGIGVSALANIFAVPDKNIASHKLGQLRLGLKIYGEDNPVILEAIRKLQAKK